MISLSSPDAALVFQALGDATRRAIIQKISEGPISVSRLAEALPISLAAVMQHLHVLEQSGLVHTEKAGRVRTCRIKAEGLSAAEQWLGSLRSTWERRLDRVEDLSSQPAAG